LEFEKDRVDIGAYDDRRGLASKMQIKRMCRVRSLKD
jgi:hypothetical protein